jgi:adenine-specific DNA methylase
VLYGECADFFYVWQKRLGTMPDWFRGGLSDQIHEATANPVRDGGRSRTVTEYTGRLFGILLEARRVLKRNGALVLFFAHRNPVYWQSAAMALALAGFRPVSAVRIESEFEHSLHQTGGAESGSTLIRCEPSVPVRGDGAMDEWLRAARRIRVRGGGRLFAGTGSG